MKSNKSLLSEVLGVIQTTNAQLGFVVEATAEGSSNTPREELVYALCDIYERNYEVIGALKEIYKKMEVA